MEGTSIWCSLLSLWAQPQVKPIFELAVSVEAAAVSKAYRGVTHEWRRGGAKSPRPQESSSLTQWWTGTHLYRHVPALQKRCTLGVQEAHSHCVRTVKDTALRWPRLSWGGWGALLTKHEGRNQTCDSCALPTHHCAPSQTLINPVSGSKPCCYNTTVI